MFSLGEIAMFPLGRIFASGSIDRHTPNLELLLWA